MKFPIQSLIGASFVLAVVIPTASGQVEHDHGLRTNISADDIVKIMAAYDRDEDNPLVLKAWIPRLEDLRDEVSLSTEMTAAEKRRRRRFIDLRISALERTLDNSNVEPQEQDANPNASYGSPGDRGTPRVTTEIPTGWRRCRDWQGGGLLPGGSWQGSEHQEVWGYSTQRTPLTNPQTSSTSQAGTQDTGIDPRQIELVPGGGWPSGWEQVGWPSQQGSHPQTGSSGGVMVGGGASSRSSRASSSRMMSRRSGQ